MIIKSPRANKNWDRWKKDDLLQEENEEFQKLFVLSSIVAAKEKQWKNSFEGTSKVLMTLSVFYRCVDLERSLLIFNPSIPYKRVRLNYLGRFETSLYFLLQAFFLKAAGDTWGSFLCIYLKCMHEMQWLTSTSLLDIHDWVKYG